MSLGGYFKQRGRPSGFGAYMMPSEPSLQLSQRTPGTGSGNPFFDLDAPERKVEIGAHSSFVYPPLPLEKSTSNKIQEEEQEEQAKPLPLEKSKSKSKSKKQKKTTRKKEEKQQQEEVEEPCLFEVEPNEKEDLPIQPTQRPSTPSLSGFREVTSKLIHRALPPQPLSMSPPPSLLPPLQMNIEKSPPEQQQQQQQRLPMESKEQNKAFSLEELSLPACGLLTGIFANGFCARFEYYLQTITQMEGQGPWKPMGRLMHLLQPLPANKEPPKEHHPILLSPYSYAKIDLDLHYFPLPTSSLSEPEERNSGIDCGVLQVTLLLFPEYHKKETYYRCMSPNSKMEESGKLCTFKKEGVKLDVQVIKNKDDILQVGRKNFLFLDMHIGLDSATDKSSRFFWAGTAKALIHHF